MGNDRDDPQALEGIIMGRVTLEMETELKAVAEKEGTNLSALVREIIENYLSGYRMLQADGNEP